MDFSCGQFCTVDSESTNIFRMSHVNIHQISCHTSRVHEIGYGSLTRFHTHTLWNAVEMKNGWYYQE